MLAYERIIIPSNLFIYDSLFSCSDEHNMRHCECRRLNAMPKKEFMFKIQKLT